MFVKCLNGKSRLIILVLALFVLIGLEQTVCGMIYRPEKGALWDTTVIYHNGTYYNYMMYDEKGLYGLKARHCFLATSQDGVHWKDYGIVLEERDPDSRLFKCFVAKCGDKFIMNHGVYRRDGQKKFQQDTLRFYESSDLKNWKYITSTHPDERWYVRPGRWDCMYTLPKEEGNPKAGYWGYVVAVPKEGFNLPAMMQSPDGVKWEVLPPAKTEWGDIKPVNHLEYGGCERIGEKYYLIGGGREHGYKGYSMFTFVADSPRGPFRPDADAYHLCGGSQKFCSLLAAWVRGNNEILISNYASMLPNLNSPWMLPLRKPVVDKDGHLHLGWWKGNEALKGQPLVIDKQQVILNSKDNPDGYDICDAHITFSLAQGAVFEGKLKARVLDQQGKIIAPFAGFVLRDAGPGQSIAIQLGIGKPAGRKRHIGLLTIDTKGKKRFQSRDVSGKGDATVTGIDNDKEHSFRLLCRMGMFELYIDDLLAQTFYYQPSAGKLGFLVRDGQAVFSDLKGWNMSLPIVADFIPTKPVAKTGTEIGK